MNNGFILIWRKIKETSFFKDSYAFHIAMYLLMKANHEPRKIVFNGQEIILSRGEQLSGREIISRETGIHPSTTYRKLLLLEKLGFLNIKSNNKFSIISICNYSTYQNSKSKNEQRFEQPANNQRTTSEQPANTNNTYNTLNTLKELKELNRENFPFLKDEVFKKAFDDFLAMRQEKKKPATARAQELLLTKLHKYSIGVAIAMLEQSIVGGWSDVYELKHDINKVKGIKDFVDRTPERPLRDFVRKD